MFGRSAAYGPQGDHPVLGSFEGWCRAVDAGSDAWLDRLAELRPGLSPKPETAILTVWHADPWALGSCSHAHPGSSPEPGVDATVAGRLVLAGEWTAGKWRGLMEGARRSGERAARQTLAALGIRHTAD